MSAGPFRYSKELSELFLAAEYEQALEICQRLVAQARTDRNDTNLLQYLTDFGDLHSELGDYDKGIAAFEECNAIRQRGTGETNCECAHHLGLIGLCHQLAGRYDTAEEYDRQALALVPQLPPDEQWIAVKIMLNLSQLMHRRGESAQAETVVLDAWRLYSGHRPWDWGHFPLLCNLASVSLRVGKRVRAKKINGISCREFDLEDNPKRMNLAVAHAYRFRAQLQAGDNQTEDAIESLQRSLVLLEKYGRPHDSRRIELEQYCRSRIEKLASKVSDL